MGAKNAERLFLLDGHSLLHRAYFALPVLTTKGGEETHAVYGFASMLRRLIDDEDPDGLAVAFDEPGPTFRHENFPAYKAHRRPMPQSLRLQRELVQELLDAMKIPVFSAPGFEADDVIGTLAQSAVESGQRVIVVSGDKDLLQLVDDDTEVWLLKKGVRELERFDEEAVKVAFGVLPGQIPDWKGLVGDPSDNIPGVPGIGEKTAARLLSEFGSVESIVARADELRGRTRQTIEDNQERALASKELATIDRAVALHVDWESLRRQEPDHDRLRSLFRRLEFRTFLAALEDEKSVNGQHAGSAGEPDPTPCRIVADDTGVDALVRQVRTAANVAMEFHFDGSAPSRAVGDLSAAAFWIDGEGTFMPLVPGAGAKAAIAGLEKALRAANEAGLTVAVHGAKRHAGALLKVALSAPRMDDTELAAYLLDPGERNLDLPSLGSQHGLGSAPPVDPSWPLAKRASAACKRAAVIAALRERLVPRLQEFGLERLYREVELPLANVLAAMEARGVGLDVSRLRLVSERMAKEIQTVEEKVFDLAGERFNLNSPKQTARVLFERLKLPQLRKTKTGPSTSAQVLEALADERPIAARLLEYRRLQKVKSAYVDALPTMVNPETGRVHTNFQQTVAATGRLASAGPNLQNIPVRADVGKQIRQAFVAKAGYSLLTADYSQIELRVLAHYSGDERLCESFSKGEDIHVRTAADVFGIDESSVTAEQRGAAKAVNFGIVYGISSFGLSWGTGLSRAEAQEFIDAYFHRYPGVRRYMDETIARAKRDGFVTTLMGRRRWIRGIDARSYAKRKAAEREAINAPIQGSAADIVKAAMVAVDERLRRRGLDAALLLQVHDELVLEARRDQVEPAAGLVKETMEGIAPLKVPLVVEVKAGPNWLDVRRV